jgi:hypothetical protein
MEIKVYRVRKVLEQFEKGLITESEMWAEINYISNYALTNPDTQLGINEGIAR